MTSEKTQIGSEVSDLRKPFAGSGNPDVSTKPPCCAEADDGICPQHEQSRRVLRHQGPRSRGGRPIIVMGDSGKAKPAPEEP